MDPTIGALSPPCSSRAARAAALATVAAAAVAAVFVAAARLRAQPKDARVTGPADLRREFGAGAVWGFTLAVLGTMTCVLAASL